MDSENAAKHLSTHARGKLCIGFLLIGLAFIGACAQEAGTPDDFLRNLYAPYAAGNAPSPIGPAAASLFDPGLLVLIQRDQQLANGEVGILDHDPICGCQDYDPLTMIAVSVEPPTGDRVVASVSFMNGTEPVMVGFQLVTVQGQWRIYDIEEANIPSLRALLETGIADVQKGQVGK